ncbi:MAG TPA: hypothetical protein VND95_05425 [Stellaceae bacterium]|nr:hypothetical protein [Stellaceae bacterium]
MLKIAAVAVLAIAGALLVPPRPSSAQVLQTTLPDLVVSAPRVLPPRRFAPTQGMIGTLRVEEDKWQVVPCAGARMAAASGTCQSGPMVMSGAAFRGRGADPFSNGDCTIVHPLITANIGRFAVEGDVLVFDPYKVTADLYNDSCTVWSGYEHMPQDFKDMNQVARRGVGWHDFRPGNGQSGAQSTIAFVDGGRSCVALERLGPPWHGGFVWVLHATLCQAAMEPPIATTDIDATVAAIQIHVYDPNGNLRPPPGG